IFVTAADLDSAETARAYALGAVDFIRKPVSAEALRAKVGFFVELFNRTREARETRTRIDTLSEIAPVGIFHTDPAGACLWVNPRWCDIAGLSPEEAPGQGWTKGLHADDKRRVY